MSNRTSFLLIALALLIVAVFAYCSEPPLKPAEVTPTPTFVVVVLPTAIPAPTLEPTSTTAPVPERILTPAPTMTPSPTPVPPTPTIEPTTTPTPDMTKKVERGP